MINKTILKNLPETAVTSLQRILNHALSMGYFPDRLETAVIKLLPKHNTDHTKPINYRPIPLLEVTGKVMKKKIMNTRLREHIETRRLLPDTQHRFRSKRGTETAITSIHETTAHHTARRDQCYLVLRDVSKAFDKVWHEGL